MYCVAEISTKVSMLTSWPRPILNQSFLARCVNINTPPHPSESEAGPLTTWLTELTSCLAAVSGCSSDMPPVCIKYTFECYLFTMFTQVLYQYSFFHNHGEIN